MLAVVVEVVVQELHIIVKEQGELVVAELVVQAIYLPQLLLQLEQLIPAVAVAAAEMMVVQHKLHKQAVVV